MAKQKRRITASFLTVMLLISVILSGCGQTPQNVPADADTSSVVESPDAQSTEESSVEESQPQPTEESQPQPTEEPAAEPSDTYPEEETGAQGDCIAVLTSEDGKNSYEIIPSEIDPAFEAGMAIKAKVTIESEGGVAGAMGTCVGDEYEWRQDDCNSEGGICVWEMEVTPVIDSITVFVWWVDGEVNIRDIEIEMLTSESDT